MAGNKQSGRKRIYEDDERVLINFYMKKSEVEKLNKMAKELCNNNRTILITQTLERLIKTYESK